MSDVDKLLMILSMSNLCVGQHSHFLMVSSLQVADSRIAVSVQTGRSGRPTSSLNVESDTEEPSSGPSKWFRRTR